MLVRAYFDVFVLLYASIWKWKGLCAMPTALHVDTCVCPRICLATGGIDSMAWASGLKDSRRYESKRTNRCATYFFVVVILLIVEVGL